MYINSPGGSGQRRTGDLRHDGADRPDITTICIGMAASMAQALLCAGAEGEADGTPNSRIMMHQPSGGSQGQVSQMEIYLKEILRTQEQLYRIIAAHSGQDVDKIRRDADRDNWMSPHDAKDYGLIDRVLQSRKEIRRASWKCLRPRTTTRC